MVAILATELFRELLRFFKFYSTDSFFLLQIALFLSECGRRVFSLEAEVIRNLGEILGNAASQVLRMSMTGTCLFLFDNFYNFESVNQPKFIIILKSCKYFTSVKLIVQRRKRQMNLEFIEMQHRESVLQLMEICGLDMNQAYQLYTNCGNNLEAAIQKKLGGQHQNFPQNIPKPKVQQNFNSAQFRGPMAQGFGDHDDQYQKYQNFKNAGIHFPQRYEIRKAQTGIRSWMPKFLKSEPENPFKKSLEAFIGKACKVQFGSGNLSQNFQKVWYNKFPFVVHLLDFKSKNKTIISQFYNDEHLVIQVLNNQFKNYGVDVNSYQLENDLKPFVNYQRAPSLLVFRINIMDQIKLLETISFNEIKSIDQIRKKLKFLKSICIQLQMEELHLQKRFKAELNGDFSYQKPISIAEKRKIAEDRAIRKKQEEQFIASMKVQEQKKVKEKIEQEKKQAQKPKFNVQQHRESIRKRLTIYNEGMMIKLRLPSGENIILTVSGREKVEYLFDYVQCQEKDMGFQRDQLRNMEIMRPYDRLNLSEHKNKTLDQIFQGSDSESLVVAEKDL